MQNSQLRSTRFFSEKLLLYAIFVLMAIGIVDSVYLLHISLTTEYGGVCPVGGCDAVLSSEHAKVFGIPVALIGLLGFVLVAGFGALRYIYPSAKTEKTTWLILLLAIAGVAYGIYLTYLELYVIHAVCPFCVLGFIMMIGVLIITSIFLFALWKEPPAPEE